MIVLLTWLYMSAFVVVLGAEINAETERQTRVDSTTGPSKPMGRRGAFAADTLGKSLVADDAGGTDDAEGTGKKIEMTRINGEGVAPGG